MGVGSGPLPPPSADIHAGEDSLPTPEPVVWLSADMCISMLRFFMRMTFIPGKGHFLTPWITGAESHMFLIGSIAIVISADLADRRALLTAESSDSYTRRYAIIGHLDGLDITTSVRRIPPCFAGTVCEALPDASWCHGWIKVDRDLCAAKPETRLA